MLLTNEQLKDWIGTTREAKLQEWLNTQGVLWWLNAKGKAVTTIGNLERVQQAEGVGF